MGCTNRSIDHSTCTLCSAMSSSARADSDCDAPNSIELKGNAPNVSVYAVIAFVTSLSCALATRALSRTPPTTVHAKIVVPTDARMKEQIMITKSRRPCMCILTFACHQTRCDSSCVVGLAQAPHSRAPLYKAAWVVQSHPHASLLRQSCRCTSPRCDRRCDE